jgi:hypothetical protein
MYFIIRKTKIKRRVISEPDIKAEEHLNSDNQELMIFEDSFNIFKSKIVSFHDQIEAAVKNLKSEKNLC